jgi:hypothetical protein
VNAEDFSTVSHMQLPLLLLQAAFKTPVETVQLSCGEVRQSETILRAL